MLLFPIRSCTRSIDPPKSTRKIAHESNGALRSAQHNFGEFKSTSIIFEGAGSDSRCVNAYVREVGLGSPVLGKFSTLTTLQGGLVCLW